MRKRSASRHACLCFPGLITKIEFVLKDGNTILELSYFGDTESTIDGKYHL